MRVHTPLSLFAAIAVTSSLHAQFDTVLVWGDAAFDAGIDGTGDRENGRASGTLTVPTPGTYEITSGGADFFGTSDKGTVIYNFAGEYTTSGNFTATVRHVKVNIDSARLWGRGALMARRTEGNAVPGVPEDDDAYFGVSRRSDASGQIGTPRRTSDGGNTYHGTTLASAESNLESESRGTFRFVGREDQDNPVFLSIGREGNRWWSAFAIDLDGNGTPGRSVNHFGLDAGVGARGMTSTAAQRFDILTGDNALRDNVGIAEGDEVTIVLGHQAHDQDVQLDGTVIPDGLSAARVNTATFDRFSFSDEFDPLAFAPTPAPDTWDVDGALELIGDQIHGAAFVRDFRDNGGFATGENVGWALTVFSGNSFTPAPGAAASKKDPNPMEFADLVPPENFRYPLDGGGFGSGLKAEIYFDQMNGGNFANNQELISARAPDGVAIIPNVSWNGNGDSDDNYFGLSGPASFAVALQGVDPASGTSGPFSADESNYGVDITGEIFIPANGGKIDSLEMNGGHQYLLFEDGVDDFTHLEIDGQVILSDNDWTSDNSVSNGGGHVGLFDVSDPKFDDGEWVSFRMITWEGGGGDSARLYWDASDENDSFLTGVTPGSFATPVFSQSGTEQLGTDFNNVPLGPPLNAGTWFATLDIWNTMTSQQIILFEEISGGPRVIDLVYHEEDNAVDVTWTSSPDSNYTLEASTTLLSDSWEAISSGIPSGGLTTSLIDFDIPRDLRNPKLFFRIREE